MLVGSQQPVVQSSKEDSQQQSLQQQQQQQLLLQLQQLRGGGSGDDSRGSSSEEYEHDGESLTISVIPESNTLPSALSGMSLPAFQYSQNMRHGKSSASSLACNNKAATAATRTTRIIIYNTQ